MGEKAMLTKEQMWEALENRHSKEVQKKLDAGRVAIAGLGGLGSNVAISLARIGVGHLHLVDFDVVDVTNLNRQQYNVEQVGQYKTDALYENLKRINPYIELKTSCVRVTEENIATLFAEEDIICEAFDVPENKAMLVNYVLSHMPEKKMISASGMAGYGKSNEIRTRRVKENFYLCGDLESEVTPGFGLMAPRVAICAAHEANAIAEILIQC